MGESVQTEPESESKPVSEPEPNSAADSKSDPKSEPEPVSEPIPIPESVSVSKPILEPVSESPSEPILEPTFQTQHAHRFVHSLSLRVAHPIKGSWHLTSSLTVWSKNWLKLKLIMKWTKKNLRVQPEGSRKPCL